MTDMRDVIVPKSDQLNSDDLISGPRTITISGVAIRPGTEQPVAISFDGDGGKPWKPCKSMSRVLVAMWGPDAKAYAGRSLTLYRDPDVTWAGMKVGGIRISHMSNIERDHTMALTVTKQSRKPFTVKPLAKSPPPSDRPQAPAEPSEKGQPKEAQRRDEFMTALGRCETLGELAELQVKLGKGERSLGEHYQECALALEAKRRELSEPEPEADHHDAFAELEPEEWQNSTGRIEDERQGELV